MQKYNGYIQRQFDSQQFGNPDSGQTVTIREHISGDIATIYSDNGVINKSNPFSADSKGRFSFFAANGRYDIEFGSPVIDSQTVSDIILFDSADFDGGIEEAPIDNKKYARKDESWDEANEFTDAPSDGSLYGRKDSDWYPISATKYPSKIGDTYVSNSGAIVSGDHFNLDGVPRLINDYPNLAGTDGFPLESADPTMFTGSFIDGSSTYNNYIISNDKNVVFNFNNSSNTSFTPFYSDDAGLTWTNMGVGSQSTLENVIPYKDDMFIATRNSSLEYLQIIRPKDLPVPTWQTINIDYAASEGKLAISDNYVLVGSPTSTTIKVSMPDDFTAHTDYAYSTVTGNSSGSFVGVEFFKGYFYFPCSGGNVNFITRTSDFVTFEPVNTGITGASFVRAKATDVAIYVSDNLKNLYRSEDGVNFVLIGSHPGTLVYRVWGTDDLIRGYQSGSSSQNKVSFDGGASFTSATSAIQDIYVCFVSPASPVTNGILTSNDGDISYTDAPVVENFLVSSVSDLTTGHKYYVKGR